MSASQPQNSGGPSSTTSTSIEIKPGFDAPEASIKALAFVTAVEKSGWVQHEPGATDWDVDRNLSALSSPLIEWANAINPNRAPFDELDRMEHFWNYASDWRIINTPENTLIPAMTLIASFGWVARFWRGIDGSLRDQHPSPFPHTRRIKHEVTGIGSHQDATLDDLGIGLDDIDFV